MAPGCSANDPQQEQPRAMERPGDAESCCEYSEDPTVPIWTAHLSFVALLSFVACTAAVFGKCIYLVVGAQ